jgi:hypothetical protein
MDVIGDAPVETSVAHADDLTFAAHRACGLRLICIEDAARDVVADLRRKELLDMTDLVDRGERVQPTLRGPGHRQRETRHISLSPPDRCNTATLAAVREWRFLDATWTIR